MPAHLRSLQWLKSILFIMTMACFLTTVVLALFDVTSTGFLLFLVILAFVGVVSWAIMGGMWEPYGPSSEE